VGAFVSEKFFNRCSGQQQCRRTRQIVAFAIGDRSQDTGKIAWQTMPIDYRACPVYTDHWDAYPHFLPSAQQHPCDKGSGLTAHQERWYNPLGSGWVVIPVEACPSPKKIALASLSPPGSCSNTTCVFAHHLPCNHYRNPHF
jgi:hypothetical protein